jgi:hypothetical protein
MSFDFFKSSQPCEKIKFIEVFSPHTLPILKQEKEPFEYDRVSSSGVKHPISRKQAPTPGSRFITALKRYMGYNYKGH